jgi:tetratricopeptide (TPR) repeat protein
MSPIRQSLLFLSALALSLSTPLLASKPTDLKSLDNDALIALFNKSRDPQNPDFCSLLSPIISEMISRPNLAGPVKETKALIDFECASRAGEWAKAYQLMPDVESFIGKDAGRVGFFVALFSDHPVNAAERLTVMAEASDGAEFLSIGDNQFYYLFRELWSGKHFTAREKTVIAILESRHFKNLPDAVQSSVAAAIIDEEGRSGRFNRSAKLLDKIQSPDRFISFLAMKEFAPIWPQIEKAAGKNLTIVTERKLKRDLLKYKTNTNDRKAFNEVAHSLHFAGKFEEVIAHASTFDHSEAGISKAVEDDAWALNVEAYSLDALGRYAEAEAIFDRIAAIPYDPAVNGWLVNFTINRGSRLVELGQWEKGLEAAILAGKITEKSGSPYAKMLVRRDKICALNNLGRGAEAVPIIAELFDARKDSYSSAAAALVCAGDADQAAKIVIEGLNDPVYANTIVTEMQSPEFEVFYTLSKLSTIRESLLTRPDVRAAFDKVARDVPDAFIPLIGKRRAELIALKLAE